MQLAQVERLARTLMDQHGLHGWTFAFDNAVKRAGACYQGQRKITLSRKLMVTWEESAVRNTLLHEIAHALAGPGAGHGARWKSIARRIGCTGDRCWSPSDASPSLPSRYVGSCPSGHTVGRERLPKSRVSCSRCSSRFDERHLLRWERNVSRAA